MLQSGKEVTVVVDADRLAIRLEMPPNCVFLNDVILIYLLTAIGLTPGGSSTVHIYTKTVHIVAQ